MVAMEVGEFVCGGGALTHGEALSAGVVVGAPELTHRRSGSTRIRNVLSSLPTMPDFKPQRTCSILKCTQSLA